MDNWTSLYDDSHFGSNNRTRALTYLNETVTRSSQSDSLDLSIRESIKDLFMVATIEKNHALMDEIRALNTVFCAKPFENWEFIDIEKIWKYGFDINWKISGIFYHLYPPKKIGEETKRVLKDIYGQLIAENPRFTAFRHYRAVQTCHMAAMKSLDKQSYLKNINRSYSDLLARQPNLYFLSKIIFNPQESQKFLNEHFPRLKINQASAVLLDPECPDHHEFKQACDSSIKNNEFMAARPQWSKQFELTSIFLDTEWKFSDHAKKEYQKLCLENPRLLQCSLILDEASQMVIEKILKEQKKPSRQIHSLRRRIQAIYHVTDNLELLERRVSLAKEKISDIQLRAKSPRLKKVLDAEKMIVSGKLTDKQISYILNDLDHRCLFLYSNIFHEMKLSNVIKIRKFIRNINIKGKEIDELIQSFQTAKIDKKLVRRLEKYIASINIEAKEVEHSFPTDTWKTITDQQYSNLLSKCDRLSIPQLQDLLNVIKSHIRPFCRFEVLVDSLNRQLQKGIQETNDVSCPKIDHLISRSFNDDSYNQQLAEFITSLTVSKSNKNLIESLVIRLQAKIKREKALLYLVKVRKELENKVKLLQEIPRSISRLYFNPNHFSKLRKQYEKIRMFLTSLILKSHYKKDAVIVENLLSLSSDALKRGNFYLAHAFYMTLTKNEIARLPKIKEILEGHEFYKILQELFNAWAGNKSYCEALKNCKIPPIPYSGVITRNITLASENSGETYYNVLRKLKRTFLKRQIALAAAYPASGEPRTNILDKLAKSEQWYLDKPEGYQGQNWHDLPFEEQASQYSEKKSPRSPS